MSPGLSSRRAAGSTPSPSSTENTHTHTELCSSFKEYIRSKYLHLLQMLNRQHGTESSPWVGKDSTGQPLQPHLPSSLQVAAGWKSFPLPGQPSAGSSSAQELPTPLILALARLKDGWEKGDIEGRKLLLLVGQRAPSVPLGWEQTVLPQRKGQTETRLHSCLLPLTLQGQEGTKLSTFCCPVFPRSLTTRRRGLGFTEDQCQCTAHMAFLTPYITMGCWGRNQQQPYPTAPEAKISMEASTYLILAFLESHIPTPMCPSAAAHSDRSWQDRWGLCLGCLPPQSLPCSQLGSRRALLSLSSSSSHAGSNSAGRTWGSHSTSSGL